MRWKTLTINLEVFYVLYSFRVSFSGGLHSHGNTYSGNTKKFVEKSTVATVLDDKVQEFTSSPSQVIKTFQTLQTLFIDLFLVHVSTNSLIGNKVNTEAYTRLFNAFDG